MDKPAKHLQLLIYIAMIDGHLDDAEKELIKMIGKRLRLRDDEIGILMNSKPPSDFTVPVQMVQRYILFDDILNLIAVDKKVTDEEHQSVRQLSKMLGFDEAMADVIVERIKRHLELGFDVNQMSHSIKHAVFALTNNENSDEKYSM